MPELSPRYNFREVEDKWLKVWEERNLFHAEPDPKKKPYTIVIPPPNITGILHMGHALNNTLQDIIIRTKRMQGFQTLWMPGTDHAGIATQNVVEKQLAKEGKTRQQTGREEFLKRLWEWKNQYGGTIIHQLKKLGSSCDWERTRFTMDDAYSEAVRHAFVSLYNKGLIYQGHYIINWCPRCQTALSDEEAEHQETQGSLYHIRYHFKENPNEFIIVATTRPETMLGDTAVAVNPRDKRYKKWIGKKLVLPILNREIRIIADEFVDPQFGTGAVKVTPAHDPNDFAMGKRHNLEFINIMHTDAKLNQNAGVFAGLDRFIARVKVIETLKDNNLLEKVEQYTHAVSHCYRCDTVVEPYLSKQWFVKMSPLAKPGIAAVKKREIKFYPKRWTKVYLNWMENIRDWCISRQIWWGHRIPVWYCVGDDHCQLKCKDPIVSLTTPTECPHCHSKNLKQDEDVLDTWFSSWLWPFATLGWPQKNEDLKYFYPTSSLFTASEIIFFWVARMIMAGYEFMGDRPFSDVYIHGTVRDTQGRKMSKSLGNALDPLEIIKEYGADALRFSLIINSGQDLFISKEKFEIGRNFANKIWNASRLILMNTSSGIEAVDFKRDVKYQNLALPSQWIISRFYSTLEGVAKAIESYRFSEAENLIYEFFWHNFCDWYLEISKDHFTDPATQQIALTILKQSIQMLHPFMPYVTEELWARLETKQGITIAQSSWPKVHKKFINSRVETDMQTLIALITAIRNTRAQWNIKPQEDIECHLTSSVKKDIALLRENQDILKSLAKIKALTINLNLKKPADAASGLIGKIKFFIPLGSLIDLAKEKQRILSQIQEQIKMGKGIASRLKNREFLKKAPAEVVEKEKIRLQSIQTKIKEFKVTIKNLA